MPLPAWIRLVVLLAMLPACACAQAPMPLQPLQIQRANYAADGQPLEPVDLPHTRALSASPLRRMARYELRFTLPAVPDVPWAVRAARMSSQHEVRVNGELVERSFGPEAGLPRPVPTLVTLPPALLRTGENVLTLRVEEGARAGLSTLDIGPEPALSPGFLRSHHRFVTLPQMLNIASAGISLFILLMWSMRRSELTLGSFGALALVASLRNHAYFLVGTSIPAAFADWLYFVAQTATATLLGVFAMAFAGRPHAAYRRALLATVLLLPPLGAVAAWQGQLHAARAWLYPWLLLMALPALPLVLVAARQRRSSTEFTLVGSLGAVLAAGVHDYLYQQGHTSVMDRYWMPYAVPVVTAIFSALLLRRLVSALADVERLNLTLERRVAERTRELQAANSAKTRFLAAASHDLRQPMVSIGLLVGLLNEQTLNAPLARIVQRLQEAAHAMEGLLKRLLDLSRLESGSVRVHRHPVALQPLLDALQAHHAEQALRKGLRLVVRPSAAVVDADPALLEQILRNLLGNAVQIGRAHV